MARTGAIIACSSVFGNALCVNDFINGALVFPVGGPVRLFFSRAHCIDGSRAV